MDFGITKRLQGRVKNKIGLDIGSFAIKAVEISYASGKPAIAGIGTKKIEDHSKETLANSIKAVLDEARISAKDVNIAVSGSSVIVRFISMPKMKPDELKGAIKFEAEKFIPFNINDCIVDFQILKKNDKENKIDLLLVAAKKDHIEERIKLVESIGLAVNAVDVDAFAVTNAFLKNYPTPDPAKTLALVNIGATLTNLSIIKGDMMCLARDLAVGGSDFSAAISKGLGVDIKTAEELKIAPKERAEEVASVTKSAINNLSDEIRLSCSYYENQCGGAIDEFYFSGGAARMAGADIPLQDSLGAKQQYWNPAQFLDNASAVNGSFAVAIGLALK